MFNVTRSRKSACYSTVLVKMGHDWCAWVMSCKVACEWVLTRMYESCHAWRVTSDMRKNTWAFIGLFCKRAFHVAHRPTQSIIWVPLQVNRFQKIIVLIVQYKYLKSCSEDFNLQNLILRTRSCGKGFIAQSSWVFHFHPTIMASWTCFVPQLYQPRPWVHLGRAGP